MTAHRRLGPALLAIVAVVAYATTSATVPAEVTLVPIKFADFEARLAKNPNKAKYTVVDAWASNCAPCKENFPHLVAMNAKFASKGLEVVSLSLDDREDGRALQSAREFLKEKKATFANFYIDEEFGAGFEHLGIGAIPAVFLYGPDGNLLRRFTMEDPDNQFTYDDVDEAVKALLDGKPLPPEKTAKSGGK